MVRDSPTDGSRLAGVDALQELWSGKPPAVPCPVMQSLAVQGKQQVARGEKVRAGVVLGARAAGQDRVGLVRRAGQLHG